MPRLAITRKGHSHEKCDSWNGQVPRLHERRGAEGVPREAPTMQIETGKCRGGFCALLTVGGVAGCILGAPAGGPGLAGAT